MLLRKVLVLAALVCLLVFAQRTGGTEIKYEIFDTDESLDYQKKVAAESLKSISLFDAVNLDFESCDQSLINRLKSASKVVRMEQERSVECESNLLALTKAYGARKRELNTTIAVLEHQLGLRPQLVRERGEAVLELKKAKALVGNLQKENDDLKAEAHALKRMQTHLKLQYEDKLEHAKQETLRSSEKRKKAWLAIAAALATALLLVGITLVHRSFSFSARESKTAAVATTSSVHKSGVNTNMNLSSRKEVLKSTADSTVPRTTTTTSSTRTGGGGGGGGGESQSTKKKSKKKNKRTKKKNNSKKKK